MNPGVFIEVAALLPRPKAIATLLNELEKNPIVLLQGAPFTGKSSLLSLLASQLPKVSLHTIKKPITLHDLITQISNSVGLTLVSQTFESFISALIQAQSKQNEAWVFLIDNIDRLEPTSELTVFFEKWIEASRSHTSHKTAEIRLIATCSATPLISPLLASEISIVSIPLFNLEETRLFAQSLGLSPDITEALHTITHGNPTIMKLMAGFAKLEHRELHNNDLIRDYDRAIKSLFSDWFLSLSSSDQNKLKQETLLQYETSAQTKLLFQTYGENLKTWLLSSVSQSEINEKREFILKVTSSDLEKIHQLIELGRHGDASILFAKLSNGLLREGHFSDIKNISSRLLQYLSFEGQWARHQALIAMGLSYLACQEYETFLANKKDPVELREQVELAFLLNLNARIDEAYTLADQVQKKIGAMQKSEHAQHSLTELLAIREKAHAIFPTNAILAKDILKEAADRFERCESDWLRGAFYRTRGLIAENQAEGEQSLADAKKSYEAWSKAGNLAFTTVSLNAMAVSSLNLGLTEECTQYYEQAKQLATRYRLQSILFWVESSRFYFLSRTGQYPTLKKLIDQMLTYIEPTKPYDSWMAEGYNNIISNVLFAFRDLDRYEFFANLYCQNLAFKNYQGARMFKIITNALSNQEISDSDLTNYQKLKPTTQENIQIAYWLFAVAQDFRVRYMERLFDLYASHSNQSSVVYLTGFSYYVAIYTLYHQGDKASVPLFIKVLEAAQSRAYFARVAESALQLCGIFLRLDQTDKAKHYIELAFKYLPKMHFKIDRALIVALHEKLTTGSLSHESESTLLDLTKTPLFLYQRQLLELLIERKEQKNETQILATKLKNSTIKKAEHSQPSIVLDLYQDRYFANGKEVKLGNRHTLLKMLLFFAEQPHRTFDKETITKAIWDENYSPLIHDPRIYSSIKRIRELFKAAGEAVRSVGGGYQLNPQIEFEMISFAGEKMKRSPHP